MLLPSGKAENRPFAKGVILSQDAASVASPVPIR